MRARSTWRGHQSGVAIEDNARALGYICWEIALVKARSLHEDYVYENDDQRVGVIREYLCFLVHVADRLVFDSLGAERRSRFIQTLGDAAARHLQRNLEDVYGRGVDYRNPFIELLNERIAEYSQHGFADRRPGYPMLRGLGRHAQNLMGEDQTNRWVIDQIMEIDAPDAVEQLQRGLDNLFASAPTGKREAP